MTMPMKRVVRISAFAFAQLCFSAMAAEAPTIVEGFRLLEQRQIPDIGARGLLFEHVRSGARLLKLESPDDNNSFCVSFVTPPEDDTGVAHILEHSVLNGSRKFPVKSPFNLLYQGSLSTFLNAMTASEHTMYPFASRHKKEFYNLLDVYLDAVFYPKIHTEPRILQQEGWHHHLEKADAELTINGVVYNEMKGAYSSPYSELFDLVVQHLFPQGTYRFQSGGHPEAIPELTQERFRAFHQRYYHPSNSFFVLYGDMNTAEQLRFLDREYLSKFDRKAIQADIVGQAPFAQMKEVSSTYPIGAGESERDQSYFALTYALPDERDPLLRKSMWILADVLVNQPGAPLRRALEESSIGKNVSAYYSYGKPSTFVITVDKANPEDVSRFKKVYAAEVERLLRQGFDRRLVEGAINRMEFELREADYGGFSKGLAYTFEVTLPWVLTGDPFEPLSFEDKIRAIRKGVPERTLAKLLERLLWKNPHAVLALVKPEKGLQQVRDQKLTEKLRGLKAAASKKQIAAWVSQTRALTAYQKQDDTQQALSLVPMLKKEDLEPRERVLALEHKPGGSFPVLFYPVDTKGIVYLRLMFDLSSLPEEMLPWATLLSSLLGELSTEKRSYQELANELNIHTGGLSAFVSVYENVHDIDALSPRLIVEGKALRDKTGKWLELAGEILQKSRLGDRKRLRELLDQEHADLQSMVQHGGASVAADRLQAHHTPSALLEELTSGLSYEKFISRLNDRFDKGVTEIIANLEKVAATVFTRQNLLVGVTATASDFPALEKSLGAFPAFLGDKAVGRRPGVFDQLPVSEGITSAIQVQHVVLGGNLGELNIPFSGKLEVLSQIVDMEYLHRKIREQGGAYGAWMAVDRNGTYGFHSYDDPHLEETLSVYAGTPEFLRKWKPTQRQFLRSVIGVIAQKDRPWSPSLEGKIAISRTLQGITPEDLQRERDEVLGMKVGDLPALVPVLQKLVERGSICIYGNEKKLAEAKLPLSRLIPVLETEGDGKMPPAPNQPPTVSAGEDRVLTLPKDKPELTLELGGKVEDDGQPEGGILLVKWILEQAPQGTSLKGGRAGRKPTLTVQNEGRLKLKLYAYDGEHSATDELTLDVRRDRA